MERSQNSSQNLRALQDSLSDLAPVKTRQNFGGLPGAPDVNVRAGQVIEVLGSSPYQWVVRFLSSHPSARAAWLSAEELELFPIALAQESIALSRVLFIERVSGIKTEKVSASCHSGKGLATLLTLLRSGLFQILIFEQAVILDRKRNLDTQLRKLQLTAEDHSCVLMMLSRYATNSFGVHLQVETQNEGAVKMKKVKGGTAR